MNKRQLGLLPLLYSLLVISSAFADVPIFSILFLFIFLSCLAGCIILILRLPVIDKSKIRRGNTLFIIGIILLAANLTYTSVEVTQHLLNLSRGITTENSLIPMPTLKFAISISLALVSSLLMTFGIKELTKWLSSTLFFIWLTIFLSAPITIILVRILEAIGFPLGA